MGSQSSKPKPKPKPEHLLSPQIQHKFTLSYYDYQDFQKRIVQVMDQIPYEEKLKFLKTHSQEDVLIYIESWILQQPEKERNQWKKYLMDGIYDVGRKFSKSRGILQSDSTYPGSASPTESTSSPEYTRYTMNFPYNTAGEFVSKVTKAWLEFPYDERQAARFAPAIFGPPDILKFAKEFIDERPQEEQELWRRYFASEILDCNQLVPESK